MKRVVLDTNVLISAFVNPQGPPGQIYDLWKRGDFALVISSYILDEFERIAKKKVRFTSQELEPILRILANNSELVEPITIIDPNIPDNDLPIIGTAIAGDANLLVTGDRDLLKFDKIGDIQVATPRRFLEILKK